MWDLADPGDLRVSGVPLKLGWLPNCRFVNHMLCRVTFPPAIAFSRERDTYFLHQLWRIVKHLSPAGIWEIRVVTSIANQKQHLHDTWARARVSTDEQDRQGEQLRSRV